MANEESSIQVAKDGPYLITKVGKLTNSKGENLKLNEVTALCRCGHSENKPYCDGSHKKANFKDDKN